MMRQALATFCSSWARCSNESFCRVLWAKAAIRNLLSDGLSQQLPISQKAGWSPRCFLQPAPAATCRIITALLHLGRERMAESEPRIGQFMDGFVGAVELLQRAAQNGFFIEYICLAASVIDGALRMGLILQQQLRTRSSALLEELLLQTDTDPILSEREIYRRAAREGVIDIELSRKLEDLYSK